MIELIIKQYLDNHFDAPVFLEHQINKPNEFILFEKTGSSVNNKLPSSTFAFQSYSTSLYNAARLNERLKSVLNRLIELKEIVSIKLESDYNYTAVDTKQYRYQAVFTIKHY